MKRSLLKKKEGSRIPYFDPEALGFDPGRFPEDFLSNGHFSLIAENLQDEVNTEIKEKFGLSDVEVLILNCFIGFLSYYFRDDAYIIFGEVPEVVKEMQVVLDSVIQKAPKHTGEILYRYLRTHDKIDFSVGETFCPSHSVTTTLDSNWEKDTDIYIIKPLPQDKTRAHDLYKIYNHADENQVNFLRNSKFIITDLDDKGNNGHKRFFMKEVE